MNIFIIQFIMDRRKKYLYQILTKYDNQNDFDLDDDSQIQIDMNSTILLYIRVLQIYSLL